MKVITNPTLVPNAGDLGVGFVYRDPDSGKVFVQASVDQLSIMAIKHRRANGYVVDSNWSQRFIDNVCQSTPGGICYDEDEPGLGQKAVALGKALLVSAKSGFQTCTQEEVEERLKVCQTSGAGGTACEYFRGIRGMFDVACGKCGCTKLKMHLKTSTCPKGLWAT